MNGKKQNHDLPLFIYQVLEEEYESLHGPIPKEVTAYLPNPYDELKPLAVKSRRDWDFGEGHIKARAAFIASLLAGASEEPPSATGPHDRAKKALLTYLRSRILGDGEQNPRDGVAETVADKQGALSRELETMLSKGVLTDKELYSDDRFSYRRLGDETRGLLSLRESGVPFDGESVENLDRLRHLNRLLLEDAFPKVFQRISDIRLSALNTLLHGKEQSALCLSGGGIRSGTLALGLIQGLARHGLLGQFDYLSTVSGGGYTGSWLTAWINRHPEGLAGVTRDLSYGDAKKVDPDPAPLQYLRRYSNFITPKVGLLTADTWTFVGIYLRNTLLNLLVFIPLLLSVLMIPRLLLALTLMQPEGTDENPEPTPWNVLGLGLLQVPHRYIFLAVGILLGSWALAYIIFNRPGLRTKLEERRPFFRGKTGQGGFLLMCMLPLLMSAFCLTTYYAWAREAKEGQQTSILTFWLFGMGFTFLGWLVASVVLKRLYPGRLSETNLLELVGLVVVGLIGGTLFYGLAQTSRSPVIGYNTSFDWLTPTWLSWKTELYICFAVPLFLLVFLLAIVIFIGLTSTSRFKFVEDEDREWWARLGAWVIISIIVWSVAHVLVIFGPIALLEIPTVLAPLGGLSGLIALLVGRSSKTPANEAEQAGTGKLAGLLGSLLPLLALFFLAFLVAALSLATTGVFQAIAIHVAPWAG
ncbi:MAG TPA: patatin-like phospholipase family protein, partial [Pyrinomonadaceae bacterium]